jgi:hypothetical protein
MTRRGRPSRDLLALAEQVQAILSVEPDVSVNEIARRVQARRNTVKRLVALLRPATAEPVAESVRVESEAEAGAHDFRTGPEKDSGASGCGRSFRRSS